MNVLPAPHRAYSPTQMGGSARLSIAASACARGCKCMIGASGTGMGVRGSCSSSSGGGAAAHPVAKSVDAVRVIVQTLGGRCCVRGELTFTIAVAKQKLKAGLNGSGTFEAGGGDGTKDVVA